jgi:hypothetical protein
MSLVGHHINIVFEFNFTLLVMNFCNPIRVVYRQGSCEAPISSLYHYNPSI